MANPLLDKIIKNSTLEATSLEDSDVYAITDFTPTPVPILNIVLSGKIDGGLTGGITTIAAPSKHFKSTLAIIMAKAYLDEYPDAVIFFYDSEKGITKEYFRSVGIDPERVIHTKIKNIEEFKIDLMHHLTETFKKGDKVYFMIDSVGNLASLKEVEDAMDGKTVVDMTRAKAFKSLYRMITPYINELDVPFVQIAHVYSELGLFPKIVVSGGTGGILAADTIILISRVQEKEGKDLVGYTFKLKIEKSRFAVEGSILGLEVSFAGGVKKYGGLLDIALDSGDVIKPKNGWYTRPCVTDDKSWRRKETLTKEFWEPIFELSGFNEYVNDRYSIAIESLVEDIELVEDKTDEQL